jgi:predicted DNA-binding protein with PD1-like motif
MVSNVQLAEAGNERTWVLVFDAGDEVMATLDAFARENHLDAAHFTAIGGFERATLGYFVIDEQRYREIEVAEQVEVLSLVGDVATDDGGAAVHAHVVVGTITGDARGGHLLRATVRPTLELFLTETPARLRKSFVPRFGLALIDAGRSTGRSP